ncbi:982_t:CDS:2 [Funneliformis mosseae]|uniref:982_t:CDS:1 n=1 Tax=Funneliformis mosseae TaxID=27381 RepID=A0A9N8V5H0_FUNMO|nr:982_t:CDS:2 [Funneliformis mosseae]
MAPKVVSPFEEFIPWAIRPLAKRLLRSSKKTKATTNTTTRESFLSNPFLKFFSPSTTTKDNSSFNLNVTKEFYKFSKLEDISVEYLLLICKDFTPYELISLAGTCKRLRELLMSDDASVQSIWRNSRLQHMRYLQLPPPYLLTEQEYIGLTMMERGCQFCGKRKNWVRVYWRYQVRSCYECYKPRFVSGKAPQNKNSTPETTTYLADLKNREAADRKQLRVTISQRKKRLTDILHELESETIEEEGCENLRLFKYDPKLLRQCPSYNAEWRLYDQPFTNGDESKLRKLMENEYRVLVEKLYYQSQESQELQESQ